MTNAAQGSWPQVAANTIWKAQHQQGQAAPLLEWGKAHGNEQKVTFLEAILGLSGARNIYGTVA